MSQIGFQSEKAWIQKPDSTSLLADVPRETINRFAARILTIPPMREQDYVAAVELAAAKLPASIRTGFRERAKKLVPNAIRTQMGCRLLEEVLSEILVEAARFSSCETQTGERLVTENTDRVNGPE